MQTQTVRVTRAFYVSGKSLAVGEVVDLPKLLAIEVKAAGKVEFVDGPARVADAGEKKKPEAKDAR